ncbi:hypothetical protein BBOR36S_01282 [Brevibacillus borstelensis]|jgi:hypothetical protein
MGCSPWFSDVDEKEIAVRMGLFACGNKTSLEGECRHECSVVRSLKGFLAFIRRVRYNGNKCSCVVVTS